jgi:hypothetical protein
MVSTHRIAESLINGGLSLLESPRPRLQIPASVPEAAASNEELPSVGLLRWPIQSRKLSTVHEVWSEYAHGFPGEMSVRDAEAKFVQLQKTKGMNKAFNWRKSEKDKVHFLRRKVYILNFIISFKTLIITIDPEHL